MTKRFTKRSAWGRAARIAAAIVCALGAFQLAGCNSAHKLNIEARERLDAKTDDFIAGNELSTDQRLVIKAEHRMRGGSYYDAEGLLDSAIQINPANYAARLDLAAVYEATHRDERADLIYRQLIQPASTAPELLNGDAEPGAAEAAEIVQRRLAAVLAKRKAPISKEPQLPLANVDLAPRLNALTAPAAPAAPPPKAPPAKPTTEAAPTQPTAMAAPANSSPAPASKPAPEREPKPKPLNVTLSTHPSEAAAKEGWKALMAKHGAVLGKHNPLFLPMAKDGGNGQAYRLATGPFTSAREAAEFCDKLLARRAYCVISG